MKKIKYIISVIILFMGISVHAQLIQAEYFWDTDPGAGNGITLLALDGNLDEKVEDLIKTNVNITSTGLHKLGVRVKDNAGHWGPVFWGTISNETLALSANRKLIQAEYFWDTDPGIGNGTPLLALDGNFDESFENIILNSAGTNSLTTGLHKLSVRVKDGSNNWGNVFSGVVVIDPCPNSPGTAGIINGISNMCAGLSGVVYSTTSITNATTYSWYYTGTGATINGNGTSVTINFAANATSGILTVAGHNTCGDGAVSTGFPITINPVPATPGTITGTQSLCAAETGINYSISPIQGATTYIWTVPYGASITSGHGTTSIVVDFGNTSGNITVKAGNTCDTSSAKSLSITVNPKPSTPIAGSNSPVTEGTPLTLTASTITGASYTWAGPNSFSSAQQNPTVSSNATTAMAGTYHVTATVNGCASDAGSTNVVVNPNSISACGLEEFNGGNTAPAGWTFTSIGGTYTSSGNYGNSSPSIKLDATGDAVETATVNNPTQLSFWLKGLSINASSALLVEGYNGTTWTTVDNITNLPTTGTTKTYSSNISSYTKFRFTYTKSAGNLAFDDVNINCGSVVGITSFFKNTALSVYPNPGTGIYTVECSGMNNVEGSIKVYDNLGKLVLTKEISSENNMFKTTIDISELDGGIYMIKLETPEKSVFKKVIKW